MRDFRLYMLVGGMPQAVNEYLNTKNMSCVDKEKRKIINLYLDDLICSTTHGPPKAANTTMKLIFCCRAVPRFGRLR